MLVQIYCLSSAKRLWKIQYLRTFNTVICRMWPVYCPQAYPDIFHEIIHNCSNNIFSNCFCFYNSKSTNFYFLCTRSTSLYICHAKQLVICQFCGRDTQVVAVIVLMVCKNCFIPSLFINNKIFAYAKSVALISFTWNIVEMWW